MITLLEMRYRFVIDLIQSHSDAKPAKRTFKPEEIERLQSEINLIGALLNTATLDPKNFEVDIKHHNDLAGRLRTNPQYSSTIRAYDEHIAQLTGDTLNEALRLWIEWVAPNALPIPLSPPRAKEPTEAFIGRKDRSKTEFLENKLVDILNKKPSDPSLRIHTEIRLARGIIRGLTIADAKAALARGWDVQHLHALNPNLSLDEIGEVFETTLTLMLEEREKQRLVRIANTLKSLSTETNKQTDAWHTAVDKLIQSLSQASYYDPYDHPILLLAETEFISAYGRNRSLPSSAWLPGSKFLPWWNLPWDLVKQISLPLQCFA
ncbi:unnamed protein product [Sphagnum jensenii]|uniref:Uncharacterized protein n=1 Tax=Sphagnum jensenii TaxID=128206 RepID=A0ABP0VAW3_9BRYO